MFLLGSELFTEFYYPTQHAAAAQYLYFGLHGHAGLVPWIWTGLIIMILGTALAMVPNAAPVSVAVPVRVPATAGAGD